MKLFFTENHIINIAAIASVNSQRGVINMVDGSKVSLSNKENSDLIAILTELHRQACEKDSMYA